MTQDRPLIGVSLMLGFCILTPVGDAAAKLLGELMPLVVLVFFRFSIQALILVPIVALTARPWRMPARLTKLMVARTLLHIVGISAMFGALKFLPLADAIAIAFVMPFILLMLGRYFLNEEVGSRRLAACVVGFVGTLLVIQPSFVEVGLPALLPLIVAVVFALFMLVTRKLAKETDPIALQAVSGVLASVLLLPALLIWIDDPLQALTKDLDSGTFLMLLAIGVIGTLAHLLMTWSLRYAPSTTLAPMQYLEIPVATLIGWLIFRDLPNGLAAVGIAITIAAGLYVILRERAIARSGPTETPA